QHGLLVSQFAPSRKVQQYFFMQRNLLMSQIAMGSFVIEDRDGGGGVKQALYSEKQGKKVFVLRETYDNRTYLWPRKFKDPVIINLSHNSGSLAKRALQIARTFGKRKADDQQPSLF
ncbi:MAG: DNA-processing protein DprA, partial [Spirochaetales bacterium]|nr:DNA-processing protein DprA [Spirochaetales bacterium]